MRDNSLTVRDNREIEKKRWKPGTYLRVVHDAGPNPLRMGELVVVVDGDRFPTLKRELIGRVGYNDFAFFTCVQGVTSDHAGFYAVARFRICEDMAVA